MSTTVDQRVVEMRFDNRQFESGVQDTMSSLEKLKSSLSLKGSAKAVQSEFDSYKSGFFSFKDAINKMWGDLERDVGQKIRNIGENLVNNIFGFDSMKAGFSEYETKINSIQTILSNTASKGTEMEDVTRVIGELNAYADKTVYNFAEMTRNIGTFTAAGVGLEESAKAIQGIANLAASSGSTSQQASTAMYQLSQALASGTVKLMDWNSVVNAGMGGEKFQEALKATAREHGVAVDDIIKKNGSFRDSLQDGWLSADILNETLNKFTVDGAKKYAQSMLDSGKYTQEQADALIAEAQAMEDAATKVKTFSQLWDTLKESAQSGWSQTWEIIFGNFEEAKELLSNVSDVLSGLINKTSDARNKMLENWKALGGRQILIDTIANAFDGLLSFIEPIKEAFQEMFDPLTSEQLVEFCQRLKDLTANMKLSDKTSNNLKRTFKGVFAIVKIVLNILKGAAKLISPLLGVLGDLCGWLLSLTAGLGDWLVSLNEAIERGDLFGKIFGQIANSIKFAWGLIKTFAGFIEDIFYSPSLDGFREALQKAKDRMFDLGGTAGEVKDSVSGAFEAMGAALEGSAFFQMLKSIWNAIKIIATGIGKALGGAFSKLGSYLKEGDFVGFFNMINGLIHGGIGIGIIGLIKNISGIFKNVSEATAGWKDIVEGVTNVLDGVAGAFKGFQNSLNASAIQKLAVAIAILAGAILVLSFIPTDRLLAATGAVATLFGEILIALTIFKKVNSNGLAESTAGIMKSMLPLAAAILILAMACKKIGDMSWEEMARGLTGVTVLLAALMGVSIGMKKLLANGAQAKTVSAVVKTLIPMALVLLLLVPVCKQLGGQTWEEWGRGLSGVVILIAALMGVSIAMKKFLKGGASTADILKASASMVIMTSAIRLIVPYLMLLSALKWEALARGGVGIIGILTVLVGAVAIMSLLKNGPIVKGAAAIVIMASAIQLIVPFFMLLSALNWEALARGVVGLIGILGTLVGAVTIMSLLRNGAVKGAASIAILTGCLALLIPPFMLLTVLNWEAIAKGVVALVGILGTLVAATALMSMLGTGGLVGAAAIAIMAASIRILIPPLLVLSVMSWEGIVKGLVAIAGAFAILGVAGLLLTPLAPTIVILAAAIALIGVGALTAGTGVLLLATGFSLLGPALALFAGSAALAVKALAAVAEGIVDLVAAVVIGLIEGFGKGLVALCQVIIDGAPAIGEAFKALLLTAIDVIVESIPAITNGILELVLGILTGLADYTPKIVSVVFDLLIGIIDSIASNMAPLVEAIVNVFMALVKGVIQAIGSMDGVELENMFLNMSMLTAIMLELALMAGLAPLAMVGIVGMGLVITELAGVLAAIGALSKIPGLMSFVESGGNFLEVIGTAIGKFIGGIAGGIAQGFTSSLPQIANDLSTFMKNLQPFIEGAQQLDASVMDGVKGLVNVILALTAANIVEGLTSWFTGGSSLLKFAQEIPVLGVGLKSFSDSVSGISPENITAAVEAAKGIAALADVIPNEGGVKAWFVGDNSIAKFGTELPILGRGLLEFSNSVAGVVPANIIAASEAAKVLAEMTNSIPNSGGITAWFAGDLSISKFSNEIIKLGVGIKGFSDAIVGVVPANIIAASEAAKVLAEMTNSIPNSGGVVAWFTGEGSISKFGAEIVNLGVGLKGFSDAVVGIVPENIIAAANAAKVLAEMTNAIPNEGGMIAWFTGESSISRFATEIVSLGAGLKGFSDAVVGIVPENVIAAANAAKELAKMTTYIPSEGGVVSWFTGESSISKFATEIVSLGTGLKGFSDAVTGITPENVTAAANAAKDLAKMTTYIPNEGGIRAWFTGETNISGFADQLPKLGKGIKGFSDSVSGIAPETVTAGAEAAKTLAQMMDIMPKEPGIKAWFAGETNVTSFAGDLPKLGKGLKGFSDSVTGIVPENITAAANAAKSLAEMTAVIPKEGGIKAWFTGDTSIANFSDKLPTLGAGLKGFADKVKGISTESTTAAANAAKTLGQMTETVPKNTDKLIKFGENIVTFGGKLKSYFSKTSGITSDSISASTQAINALEKTTTLDAGNMKSVSKGLDELVKSIKGLAKVPKDCTSNFKKALKDLGETSAKSFTDPFKDADDDMKKAGKEALQAFIDGVKGLASKAKSACSDVLDKCVKALKGKSSSFESAGKAVVEGFARGISSNAYKAEAKAKAMAKAAAEAAKKELDVNSPSKVFMALGTSVPEGFAMGIDKLGGVAKASAVSMAKDAIRGATDSLSNLAKAIDSDIDSQPVIRPVLDLSDVRAGAGTIGSLFNSSVGVSANVGAIGTLINRQRQNGANDDVISELSKLRKDVSNLGSETYNINGVSYDAESDVAEAIKTIARAAQIERRR